MPSSGKRRGKSSSERVRPVSLSKFAVVEVDLHLGSDSLAKRNDAEILRYFCQISRGAVPVDLCQPERSSGA